MTYSALDLVEALVDRAEEPGLVALDLHLDGTVSELAALLEAVDPAGLDADRLVSYLRLTERVAATVAAVAQDTVAAVADATEALGLHPTDARHELAAALRLSPVTASARVRVALDLRDRFPATLEALHTGRISNLHATYLSRETEGLDDATAAAVEAQVLPVMPVQTAAETRRALRDAVVRVDPGAATSRADSPHQQRRVERVPDRDGRTGWYLPLDAGTETEMWARTTARARAVQAARVAAGLDDPGLDALRVDLVVDAILGQGAATGLTPTPDQPDHTTPEGAPVDGSAPRLPRCTCGGAQTAAVVLDLPTALRLADNPGHLPGYGAVPADLARRMAADRDWVRWVVEPHTGHLLDRGARSYRPSDRLRGYIAARDQTCGFPGCNRPAAGCDCDHVQAYRAGRGGRTVRLNLGPLCRQHHNAKTHRRWKLGYDPATRTKTWTSPLGLTYLKHATPVLT